MKTIIDFYRSLNGWQKVALVTLLLVIVSGIACGLIGYVK